MEIKQTEDEIFTVLDKATDSHINNRDRYAGMTYQEGVMAALDWILGRGDVPLLEEQSP
jgi:hypothetical protein